LKTGTVPIQSSDIPTPGSSVTGTATYKITDADINTGSVTNLASAIGSFNNQPVISPQNIETVHYKQPTSDRANNNGFDNGGYGDAVVPVVPIPMMYSSHTNGPYRTTETPNSESNGHKAKAYLSKHKHHTIKHHKTGKKIIQNRELKIELKKLNIPGIRCKQIAIWCAPSNVYQYIQATEDIILFSM
jgi:hypothetical protein